jgi:palmitoyltransferase
MFFLVACFGIATSVLLFFHVYLVCSNKTTIENMEPVHLVDGKDRRLYNLGVRENLRQVFGSNLLLAFLPVFTSEGDGTEFKMRRAASDLAAARMRWSTRRERFPRPSADETEDETSETQPLRH